MHKRLKQSLRNLIVNQKAATAIEYGLIAALVSVVVISAMTLVGSELNNSYDYIGSTLNSANNST